MSEWLCRFLNQTECVSHQGTVDTVAMRVMRSVCNATLFAKVLPLHEQRLVLSMTAHSDVKVG